MIIPRKGITPLIIARTRLSKFAINSKDKVLDLGCGDGRDVSILKELGVFNIVGLDISREYIKEAKKNHPDIKFILGSAEKLPFKQGSFDIVLVDSVFHHLKDYEIYIQEIKRVLTKNGKLCFIEPHGSVLRKILDVITILPVSKFLPFFKERQPDYLIEKVLMEYWLKKEQKFLNLLKKQGFKKEFLRVDLLSIIGQYQKI